MSKIGLFYKASDSDDLKKQRQKLLSSPSLAKQMSQKTRAFAEKMITNCLKIMLCKL